MLRTIRLQNFRSYTDDSFEFDDGVNIIVGPNASGKTNLLESILVLCRGNSFRNKDPELVSFDAPWARLDGLTAESARTLKLIPQTSGSVKKELTIDDKLIKRIALNQTLPAVLFEPNHLMLLHGSPDLRREYIDGLLEQTVTGYSKLRSDYRRALYQRNTLLKQGADKSSSLFVWNIRLSEIGGQIAVKRRQLVKEISQQINDLYNSLSHSEKTATIRYESRCNLEQYGSDMLHKLEQSQEKDLTRGFTSYGPHRDDIVVELDGHTAQTAASRGETRSLLLVLKIMELKIVENVRGRKPILLLDDVFSELDGARRRALTEALSGYQTFITTTDADVVVQHFTENCHIIPTNT